MNKLWAPWRRAYILGKKTKGCFVCAIKRSKRDRANGVLARTPHSIAVLNQYPYNNGHVMVVPKRHVRLLSDLSDEESLDLLRLANQVMERIRQRMNAQGFNWGINFGQTGGAGLPGHIHLHIVPRWKGDTNFMPVTADTKVISESLASAYRTLAFSARSGRSKKL